jgi:hypothetical protein
LPNGKAIIIERPMRGKTKHRKRRADQPLAYLRLRPEIELIGPFGVKKLSGTDKTECLLR